MGSHLRLPCLVCGRLAVFPYPPPLSPAMLVEWQISPQITSATWAYCCSDACWAAVWEDPAAWDFCTACQNRFGWMGAPPPDRTLLVADPTGQTWCTFCLGFDRAGIPHAVAQAIQAGRRDAFPSDPRWLRV